MNAVSLAPFSDAGPTRGNLELSTPRRHSESWVTARSAIIGTCSCRVRFSSTKYL